MNTTKHGCGLALSAQMKVDRLIQSFAVQADNQVEIGGKTTKYFKFNRMQSSMCFFSSNFGILKHLQDTKPSAAAFNVEVSPWSGRRIMK